MSRQNARQQQFDQYDNRMLSSNFQRRFYFVNQSYRSNAYQNNQYISYLRNYDFQSYDYQNQNQNNQNNQEYRSNQNQFSNVVLFTSSVRLQITIDSIIISTSNASSSGNQNQNQRRFFQFRFNQFYRSDGDRYDKIQRMYQASVKNEMSNISSKQIDEQNIDKNENQNTYHVQHEKNNN